MPNFADQVLEFGGAPVGARYPLGARQKQVFIDIAANGGSDGNDGLTPKTAVLSFYSALAKCVSGRRDVIRVMHYASANEVEWPISVAVAGVTIIGEEGGGVIPRYTNGTVIDSVGDFDCMHLDESAIRVQGFDFRAGATKAGIKFDTAGKSRPGIFNNKFTSGLYGIWASKNSAPSTGAHIAGNMFTGSVTDNGILWHTDGPFNIFEKNIFFGITGVALYSTSATGAASIIRDNYFHLPTDSAGYAITLAGINNYTWIIAGNKAAYTYNGDGASTNPYRDLSQGATNAWVDNYKGIALVEPATS